MRDETSAKQREDAINRGRRLLLELQELVVGRTRYGGGERYWVETVDENPKGGREPIAHISAHWQAEKYAVLFTSSLDLIHACVVVLEQVRVPKTIERILINTIHKATALRRIQ